MIELIGLMILTAVTVAGLASRRKTPDTFTTPRCPHCGQIWLRDLDG